MYSTLPPDTTSLLRAHYGPLPVGAVVCGPDLRILYANRQFFQLTECTSGDLSLMLLPDLLSMFCLSAEMKSDGLMAFPGIWREADKPVAMHNGALAWMRARLEAAELPGLGTCHLVLIENVTRYKVALEALINRKNLYQSIVETRPDLICCFLPDWSLTYANSSFARFFGIDREQAVGEDFLRLIEPDMREAFGQAATAITPAHPIAELEFERKGADPEGESIWLRWIIQGFFYKTGHIRDYQATAVDITAQKATESQFFHADRLVSLGTLVSEVAHEISNPNNFIMLNAPLVLDLWRAVEPSLKDLERLRRRAGASAGPDPLGGLCMEDLLRDVPNLLEGIIEGSRRIRDFVWELKNFARKDTDGGFELLQVNDVVQSAVLLMSKTIGLSTSRFCVRYGQGLPLVRGRRQRLEQIVVNLVQNACHALTGPHQAIEIGTSFSDTDDTLRITVRDEGVGIDPEALPRITEPFYSTKRDQGGTGLGLSISLSIAREHGGRLEIASSLDIGTTAQVILPAIYHEHPSP